MSESSIEEEDIRVSFVVTGFGRFGGVSDNPTTILVSQLETYIERNDYTLKCQAVQPAWEVSFESVQNQLETLYESFSQNDDDDDGVTDIVVIHLGVDAKAKGIKLERCGVNEATYRIPDEKGYQPKDVSIISNRPLKHIHETTLPLRQILAHCKEKFPNNTIQMSGDAGRYVCNTTYYTSLHHATQQQQHSHKNSIHVLFVHVPYFNTIDNDKQLFMLCEIMKSIEFNLKKQYKKKAKKKSKSKTPSNGVESETKPSTH